MKDERRPVEDSIKRLNSNNYSGGSIDPDSFILEGLKGVNCKKQHNFQDIRDFCGSDNFCEINGINIEDYIRNKFGESQCIHNEHFSKVFKLGRHRESYNGAENHLVLKVRVLRIDGYSSYLDSLKFHKKILENGSEELRKMTLPIYDSYAVAAGSLLYLMTEFMYVEKTMSDFMQQYIAQEDLRREHARQLIYYLDIIHSQIEGRNFISDIKPENIFVYRDQLLMNDLEFCGGTPAYVYPEFLFVRNNHIATNLFDSEGSERIKGIKMNDRFAAKMLLLSMYSGKTYDGILGERNALQTLLHLQNRETITEQIPDAVDILKRRAAELFGCNYSEIHPLIGKIIEAASIAELRDIVNANFFREDDRSETDAVNLGIETYRADGDRIGVRFYPWSGLTAENQEIEYFLRIYVGDLKVAEGNYKGLQGKVLLKRKENKGKTLCIRNRNGRLIGSMKL